MRRLYALDEAAAALGLYVGQKAADAMALAPELTVADADPDGDLTSLGALVDWCVRFSPAVAADPPDGLLLDVTGVAHLWGGEGAMPYQTSSLIGRGPGIAFRCHQLWRQSQHGQRAIQSAGRQKAD